MGVSQDGLNSAPPPSHQMQENGLFQPEGNDEMSNMGFNQNMTNLQNPIITQLRNPEGERPTSISTTVQSETRGGKPLDRGKPPSLLRRPCFYLTTFVKALPVIFISSIVVWSYYAYFVAVVLNAMAPSPAEQVICAVVFHCLTALFVWSYAMVIFTPPGFAPSSWHLSPDQVDKLRSAQSEEEWKALLFTLAEQLGCRVKQRSVQNAVRYCEKCLAIKPDRSHHCSVCEKCTLKMDHHCPWVNNCVGFHNYKFFLLFLGYAISYCLWIAATSFQFFLRIWLYREEDIVAGSHKYQVLFVFFVSILFSLSLSSLFWYHIWLLLHNRSTLEQFRAPMFENNHSDPEGWSLGKLDNIREVMGPNAWLWLVPVKTALGDGITFPTRIPLRECTTFHSIGQSLPSRPETPSRTLINPVLGPKGEPVVSSIPTTARGSLSPDCRLTITPDESTMLKQDTITPDSGVAETEVRLDTSGYPQTVISR